MPALDGTVPWVRVPNQIVEVITGPSIGAVNHQIAAMTSDPATPPAIPAGKPKGASLDAYFRAEA